MEDTQEIKEQAHEEVISDKTSEMKPETRDEILSRHRWFTLHKINIFSSHLFCECIESYLDALLLIEIDSKAQHRWILLILESELLSHSILFLFLFAR